MKVIIIGGFLGSGKTTVLMELVPYLAKQATGFEHPVAVLENEIALSDVDSKMLQSRGMEVRTLTAGCICCTASGALEDSVRTIREQFAPAYLVVEATGMAYPDAIAQAVRDAGEDDVRILVLADAKRWKKLKLAMPKFVESQLCHASVVFLNKIDLVEKSAWDDAIKDIEMAAPTVQLFLLSAINGIDESCFYSLQ